MKAERIELQPRSSNNNITIILVINIYVLSSELVTIDFRLHFSLTDYWFTDNGDNRHRPTVGQGIRTTQSI